MTFLELARRVRAQLGQDHRYAHCVRVARCAEVLAQRHGEDPARARTAGMLHDLARLYTPARLLEESAARGLEIDAYARRFPVVLHAGLSAELAREGFGIADETVLSAIRKHTLGDAQMSRLDAILYLADGLEPGRTFKERGELARIAMRDLVDGMRATLASSLRFLEAKGLSVAPQTQAAIDRFNANDPWQEVHTGRAS
ncbi:MAG: bis(5'-nucleosyl)-tetraphosphatase (symmetrical) YqeK [Candidatus Eremiobacteraeota bacterium]|nr:bis(5'-nucleosyl)-tetraphosphatase (symmetrical) YqeK [Candidatus Eremiobacteraeota bacterium]